MWTRRLLSLFRLGHPWILTYCYIRGRTPYTNVRPGAVCVWRRGTGREAIRCMQLVVSRTFQNLRCVCACVWRDVTWHPSDPCVPFAKVRQTTYGSIVSPTHAMLPAAPPALLSAFRSNGSFMHGTYASQCIRLFAGSQNYKWDNIMMVSSVSCLETCAAADDSDSDWPASSSLSLTHTRICHCQCPCMCLSSVRIHISYLHYLSLDFDFLIHEWEIDLAWRAGDALCTLLQLSKSW
jgi:hypothetical protein